ncbi:hypothetical protein HYV30_00755 [Candidatus Kaiserbacteria bacterium]|nr:hypothetical protein [Candidatus Kaiserbacteria bacterium]
MKNRLSVPVFIVAVLLASAAPALAQTESVPQPNTVRPASDTQKVRELRQNVKTEAQTIRQDARTELNTVRQNAVQKAQEIQTQVKIFRASEVEAFRAKREEAQTKIQQVRSDAKARLETARTEVKTKIEAERTELKAKLEKIRDERKKQAVEKIDNQITALSERMSKHYVVLLDKLDGVLERIEARMTKAEANGRDVAPVKEAIAAAKTAIASARSAATVQTGKTYALAISTEANLRPDVGRARDALRTDLEALKKAVFAARDAVHSAATKLGQIQGVDKLEVSTAPASTTTPATASSTSDGTN